jgi:hypothetical protein
MRTPTRFQEALIPELAKMQSRQLETSFRTMISPLCLQEATTPTPAELSIRRLPEQFPASSSSKIPQTLSSINPIKPIWMFIQMARPFEATKWSSASQTASIRHLRVSTLHKGRLPGPSKLALQACRKHHHGWNILGNSISKT